MNFYRSRYTLSEPWQDGYGLLLNTFSGSTDIVSKDLAHFVKTYAEANLAESQPAEAMLIGHGYYVESREVEEVIARRVAEQAKERARKNDEAKYMFALTLRCNLACSYCWQVIEHADARQHTALMAEELVDAAFAFIERDLQRRGRDTATVSLFGGEPLIDEPDNRHLVRLVGDRAKARGMRLHFTTNGHSLYSYREEVRRYMPSIQITIDGAGFASGTPVLKRDNRELGDLYRVLTDIVSSGEAQVFLRFLVNQQTIPEFVALADVVFADTRLSNLTLAVAPLQNRSDLINPLIPPKFKTLSALMAGLKGRSYTPRISYVDWRSLNLFEGLRGGLDLLPAAAFYHCEANIDLMCFDYDGRLYACYEAIGNKENAVGTYWPRIQIDEAHLAQYRERSAFSIPECAGCALSPFCGGGCQVRGYKKNGLYMRPYCDALHAETSQTMRRWLELEELLLGAQRGYGTGGSVV